MQPDVLSSMASPGTHLSGEPAVVLQRRTGPGRPALARHRPAARLILGTSVPFQFAGTQTAFVLLLEGTFARTRPSLFPLDTVPPRGAGADSGSRCPHSICAAGFPGLATPHSWDSATGGRGLRQAASARVPIALRLWRDGLAKAN